MDDDLDDLLAGAAARRPAPSAALLARIEADGLREQPKPAAPLRPKAPAPKGWGLLLADVFGGSGGVAGLTLAAVSGLWIGVAQPASFSLVTEYLGGTVAMELLPSDAALLTGE